MERAQQVESKLSHTHRLATRADLTLYAAAAGRSLARFALTARSR
jgi:hypothetical protein